MAKLYNIARMSTATSGTGTITLGSAVTGFLSFAGAGVSNGETVTYGIEDGAHREIGRGVYTSSGTTLTRTVLKSTNSDTAISLSGTAEVFITAAKEDIFNLAEANTASGANTFSAKQTFSNTIKLQQALEKWNIVADNLASGDNDVDVLTAGIWYWTTAGDTNATLDFRGDGSNSLDSLMAVGDSVTVTAILTHTGTAYYINALKIDNSSVTPKWVDGTAPSAGSTNALDVYTFTILKTASATFTVFAQKVKWDEA